MTRWPRALVGLMALGALTCGCHAGTSSTAKAPPATAVGSDSSLAPSATTAKAATTESNDPGDIPDNQVFVTYGPPQGVYTVKVPEGWARTEADGGTEFTDKFNRIRLETKPAAAAPTVATAKADDVPGIQASVAHYEAGKVSTAARKGGTFVLITYRADSPADPVTGKVVRQEVQRYETWRDGVEAVITLSSPVGADNVDPWRIVTDSFTWR